MAACAILDRMDIVDHPTLAWWLAERQLPNGGLNGRPEKLEDVSRYRPWPSFFVRCRKRRADERLIQVCYSWWDLSALSILGKLHWIDRDKLMDFILSSQVRQRRFSLPPQAVTDVRCHWMLRTWRREESQIDRAIGSMCSTPTSGSQVRSAMLASPDSRLSLTASSPQVCL